MIADDTPTPNSVDPSSRKSSFDSLSAIAPSESRSIGHNSLPHYHGSAAKKKVSFDKAAKQTHKLPALTNIFVFRRPTAGRGKKAAENTRDIREKPKRKTVSQQPLVWLSNGTRPFSRRQEILKQVRDEMHTPNAPGKSFFCRQGSPDRDNEVKPDTISTLVLNPFADGKEQIQISEPQLAANPGSVEKQARASRTELKAVGTNKANNGEIQEGKVLQRNSKPVASSRPEPHQNQKNRNTQNSGSSIRHQTTPLFPVASSNSNRKVASVSQKSQFLSKDKNANDRRSRSEMMVNNMLSPSSSKSRSHNSPSSQSSMSMAVLMSTRSNSKTTNQVTSKATTSASTSRTISRTSGTAGRVIHQISKVIKRTSSGFKRQVTPRRDRQKRKERYMWEDEPENNAYNDANSQNNEVSSDSDEENRSQRPNSNISDARPYSPTHLTARKEAKTLIKSCESYMNWCKGFLKKDKLEVYIQKIKTRFLDPPPKGEFILDEVISFNEFEFYSSLGALCFFQIELQMFEDAANTIKQTQQFVTHALDGGHLRHDCIYSFDYVWDFLRLYGFLMEHKRNRHNKYFLQMDLSSFSNFGGLKSNVKAGIYGLKAYFYALVGYRLDKIVETLRAAVFLENDYYDWYLLLGRTLRCSRRNRTKIAIKPVGIEEELQAVSKATELAPSNPRCIIAGMQAVLDMAADQERKNAWNVFQFGHRRKFYHMANVTKFLKDQALLVVRHSPRSIDANMALVEIFASLLSPPRRDLRFAKECLERCLKYHPKSSRVHAYMGLYFLLAEQGFKQAEIYFDTAFALDSTNFVALKNLLLLMMRTLVIRQTGILEVTKVQMRSLAWDRKQKGILHYLRGLTFLASSRQAEAFEEFFTARRLSSRALSFEDLPDFHHTYGWSGWPNRTLLSYGNIRLEAQIYSEKDVDETDADTKLFIHALVEILSRVEEDESRKRMLDRGNANKGQMREQAENTKSYFSSTKISFLEE